MTLAPDAARLVTERWDEIVPILHDYIAIPNVSEAFDLDWRANGHMQRAVDLVHGVSVDTRRPAAESPDRSCRLRRELFVHRRPCGQVALRSPG